MQPYQSRVIPDSHTQDLILTPRIPKAQWSQRDKTTLAQRPLQV